MATTEIRNYLGNHRGAYYGWMKHFKLTPEQIKDLTDRTDGVYKEALDSALEPYGATATADAEIIYKDLDSPSLPDYGSEDYETLIFDIDEAADRGLSPLYDLAGEMERTNELSLSE